MRRRWLTMRDFQGALHGFTGLTAYMRAQGTAAGGATTRAVNTSPKFQHGYSVRPAPSKCQQGATFRRFGACTCQRCHARSRRHLCWLHVATRTTRRLGTCWQLQSSPVRRRQINTRGRSRRTRSQTHAHPQSEAVCIVHRRKSGGKHLILPFTVIQGIKARACT